MLKKVKELKMLKYVIKRILWLIPVLLGVTILVYTIMYFTPGDPAVNALGNGATEEEIMNFNVNHGLEGNYITRLLRYMKNVFLHFDFGTSYMNQSSVSAQIMARLPYTLLVSYIGVAISLLVGIPLGVAAATHQNTWIDSLSMVLSMFCVSMPVFWFALILVMMFSLRLGWLPSIGTDSWLCYIMPCMSIGVGGAAGIARQTRSSMLEVIHQDYVVTARAKGQKENKVITKHCLRNGMIPVLTVVGGSMAALVGNSLVCETIFSIPGVGSYMITGVNQRDMPVVLGCVIVLAFLFSLTMLVCDLLYTVIDPRLKTMFVSKSK
jgi:ABC-type dipeptide/oligopeptide/nickel transport system permease component